MQPSAGPALPHTRTRAVHWLTTAVALGAVVGAVALVQPADASPTASRPAAGQSTHGGRAAQGGTGAGRAAPAPAAAPDPNAVTYPLDCAPGVSVAVLSHVSADLDGDGRPDTVVVVRCQADTGTPPSGVYVLSAAAGGAPRIVETLVRPQDDREIANFRLQGRTVRATVLGFSGDTVPRCCPDLQRAYTWEWRDGRYVAIPGPPPNSV
ncbi:hypothetical protein VSR01_06020 [Actinacidiphila sp. DG2A-62]|uniref:hypothetical protein n=1 Tax=Actinacidiphila sp. DG2A-62 TaxID=3108821 RepID=UPI002DB79228|nr:hypothetical protein [Actinacidiphila sp. DG2A-62]MEC3993123.1 hypothetical protein [Actinacidiphila sp. DG2A-62]